MYLKACPEDPGTGKEIVFWHDTYTDYDIYVFRHIVFAPSSHNVYASSKFPGIVDALFPDSPDWELVKQELSIALLTIQQASESIIQNH